MVKKIYSSKKKKTKRKNYKKKRVRRKTKKGGNYNNYMKPINNSVNRNSKKNNRYFPGYPENVQEYKGQVDNSGEALLTNKQKLNSLNIANAALVPDAPFYEGFIYVYNNFKIDRSNKFNFMEYIEGLKLKCYELGDDIQFDRWAYLSDWIEKGNKVTLKHGFLANNALFNNGNYLFLDGSDSKNVSIKLDEEIKALYELPSNFKYVSPRDKTNIEIPFSNSILNFPQFPLGSYSIKKNPENFMTSNIPIWDFNGELCLFGRMNFQGSGSYGENHIILKLKYCMFFLHNTDPNKSILLYFKPSGRKRGISLYKLGRLPYSSDFIFHLSRQKKAVVPGITSSIPLVLDGGMSKYLEREELLETLKEEITDEILGCHGFDGSLHQIITTKINDSTQNLCNLSLDEIKTIVNLIALGES